MSVYSPVGWGCRIKPTTFLQKRIFGNYMFEGSSCVQWVCYEEAASCKRRNPPLSPRSLRAHVQLSLAAEKKGLSRRSGKSLMQKNFSLVPGRLSFWLFVRGLQWKRYFLNSLILLFLLFFFLIPQSLHLCRVRGQNLDRSLFNRLLNDFWKWFQIFSVAIYFSRCFSVNSSLLVYHG